MSDWNSSPSLISMDILQANKGKEVHSVFQSEQYTFTLVMLLREYRSNRPAGISLHTVVYTWKHGGLPFFTVGQLLI